MKNIDKNLSNILNTEYSIVESGEDKPIVASPQQEDESQIKADADYARSNLYGLIEKGNETIENISEIAKESMHPRAFEVLGQLIKTQSENLDKLMKLQKDKKELTKSQESADNQKALNIDKAVVFTGSTTDLLKQIRAENEVLHNIQNNKQD